MSLETGTYISDLNTSNPASGDAKSQGDDHLRLIKSTVKATFPNVTGAVTATHTALNAAATNILTNGTATASTSGTSIDFTSIPSWVKKITFQLYGVSTSGTSNPIIQLGDSGGVENTGYLGASTLIDTGVSTANYTDGFGIRSGNASNVLHGSMVISLVDSATNKWVAQGSLGLSNSAAVIVSGGSKATSATLDRVRLTTSGGTDTFDAGTVNVLYE